MTFGLILRHASVKMQQPKLVNIHKMRMSNSLETNNKENGKRRGSPAYCNMNNFIFKAEEPGGGYVLHEQANSEKKYYRDANCID